MQTLVPTAVRLNNLSGSAADLDDSPDSPDGSWCENAAVVPQWWADLTENTWYEIAGGAAHGDAWQNGNRVYDVKPANYESYGNGDINDIVNAYTGGCASSALKEVYLPAQGGHAAYAGNEIYALKLNQAVPAWERIWGPSAVGDITSTNPGNNAAVVKNADTTPRSMHGWFQCHVDNAGRIWVGQSGPQDDGTGTHQSCYWSIARGTGSTISGSWMFHGRLYVPTTDGGDDTDLSWGDYILLQSAPGAYDSVGDKIWRTPEGDATPNPPLRGIPCATAVAAGAAAQSGDNEIASLTKLGTGYGTQFSAAWSFIVTDGSPRCWVIPTGANAFKVFDVETPGSAFVDRTASGTGTGQNGCNAFYVPDHNAAYVFGAENGATVRKLSISGSDPKAATYAWSTLTNGGGSATPANVDAGTYSGTYSKAQGILDMGDGRAALVIASNVQGPTYIYKLPAS